MHGAQSLGKLTPCPPLKKLQSSADPFGFVLVYEVHFVDEAEDLGVGRVLKDRFQTWLVVVEVAFQLAAFHVENVDQHLDVSEYALALAGDVALHERLLSATKKTTEGIQGIPNDNYMIGKKL